MIDRMNKAIKIRPMLWTLSVLCFTLYPIIELTRFIIEYSTLNGWNAIRIAEVSHMWPLYLIAMAIVYYLASKRQPERGKM